MGLESWMGHNNPNAGYLGSQAHIEAELHHARVMAELDEANAALRAKQHADARYREGYNSGHQIGWNEAMDRANHQINLGNTEIVRLRAELARQQQLNAELQRKLDDQRADAQDAIAAWSAHSEKLKTRNQELQGLVTTLQASTEELATQVKTLTESNAEHVATHQRSLVFMNTVSQVLDDQNGSPEEDLLKIQFVERYVQEVDAAMDEGRISQGLERDQLFAKHFPKVHGFLMRILDEGRRLAEAYEGLRHT